MLSVYTTYKVVFNKNIPYDATYTDDGILSCNGTTIPVYLATASYVAVVFLQYSI